MVCIPQRARLGRGGLLVKRLVKGWTTVFDGGPTGNSNDLCDAAATDDSTRASVVGDSGAIGNYNLETGNLNDRSAPMDVTNNFNDVAVTGEGGEDNAYITGNSGKMHFSFENGEGGIWGGRHARERLQDRCRQLPRRPRRPHRPPRAIPGRALFFMRRCSEWKAVSRGTDRATLRNDENERAGG